MRSAASATAARNGSGTIAIGKSSGCAVFGSGVNAGHGEIVLTDDLLPLLPKAAEVAFRWRLSSALAVLSVTVRFVPADFLLVELEA
jgi:hypothetical protein